MKNFTTKALLFTFAIATFGVGVQTALACSFAPGYQHPTAIEVINDGGHVFMGKVATDTINAQGIFAIGSVIDRAQGQTPSSVLLVSGGTSCDTKFSFTKGQYFAAVTDPAYPTRVTHGDGDRVFVSYFNTESEARAGMQSYMAGNNPRSTAFDKPAGGYIDPNYGDNNNGASGYVPAGYTLRPGMKNNQVANLQRALNKALNRSLTLDGSYGPMTIQAVVDFQRMKGLIADGLAGNKTQSFLSSF